MSGNCFHWKVRYTIKKWWNSSDNVRGAAAGGSINSPASAGKKAKHRRSTRKTYIKKIHNCFSKAHHIHGYSYCIGKSKYQADRASKLWAQTPGNQIISSTWKQREKSACWTWNEKQSFLLNQRQNKKRWIPPRTNPLVAMAEVERPVIVVTTVAMRTIRQESAAKKTKQNKSTLLIFLSTDAWWHDGGGNGHFHDGFLDRNIFVAICSLLDTKSMICGGVMHLCRCACACLWLSSISIINTFDI